MEIVAIVMWPYGHNMVSPDMIVNATEIKAAFDRCKPLIEYPSGMWSEILEKDENNIPAGSWVLKKEDYINIPSYLRPLHDIYGVLSQD